MKLWQFDPADRAPVRVNTADLAFDQVPGQLGIRQTVLHRSEGEEVRLERWSADATVELQLPGGGEFFVIKGGFQEGDERFEGMSWLRMPAGSTFAAMADTEGCLVWVKTRQLGRMIHRPAAN